MTQATDQQQKAIGHNSFIFPVAMWLSSRLLIVAAMLLIAPLFPTSLGRMAPTSGWSVFSFMDSTAYQMIATSDYHYVKNGKLDNVAFFPLFPLLIRAVMALGLPFEVAGTLVNNLAFLGAVIVLYRWVEEFHGINAARWAAAVLAWCPLSLFGTVVYSEGLFLLFSTAALRAFDRQQYPWLALWGTFATAARPTGIVLLPAFFIAAWKQNRGAIAYIASLAAGSGLFLYSLYCGIRFGDPIAFINAQKSWRPEFGFNWFGWWKMVMQVTVGWTNWQHSSITDPWHPLLFVLICGIAYLLWRQRSQLGSITLGNCFFGLGFILWILGGDPLTNLVIFFGGGYFLWHLRAQLSPVTLAFGFCGLGLLLVSGSTISLNRLTYGIVSIPLAFGVFISSYPRWGYAVMGFFAILLTSFAIRFAQHQWVA